MEVFLQHSWHSLIRIKDRKCASVINQIETLTTKSRERIQLVFQALIHQEFIVQPSIMNSKVFAGLTIKAENNGLCTRAQVLDLVYLTNPIITFADAIYTIPHHPMKKLSTKNIDFEGSN